MLLSPTSATSAGETAEGLALRTPRFAAKICAAQRMIPPARMKKRHLIRKGTYVVHKLSPGFNRVSTSHLRARRASSLEVLAPAERLRASWRLL